MLRLQKEMDNFETSHVRQREKKLRRSVVSALLRQYFNHRELNFELTNIFNDMCLLL